MRFYLEIISPLHCAIICYLKSSTLFSFLLYNSKTPVVSGFLSVIRTCLMWLYDNMESRIGLKEWLSLTYRLAEQRPASMTQRINAQKWRTMLLSNSEQLICVLFWGQACLQMNENNIYIPQFLNNLHYKIELSTEMIGIYDGVVQISIFSYKRR